MADSQILTLLTSAKLFKVLAPGELRTLAREARWVDLIPGQVLFREGEKADAAYVLATGCLSVSVISETQQPETQQSENKQPENQGHPPEKEVAEISPPGVVGEIQLLTMGDRTATIRAKTASRLIRLPARAFEQVAQQSPDFFTSMGRLIRERLFMDRLAQMLPKLFGPLSRENLSAIIDRGTRVSVQRGEVLFCKGDPGDSFYILVEGRMAATVSDRICEFGAQEFPTHAASSHGSGSDDSGSHGFGTRAMPIYRGESIGELALLSDDLRSATVYAQRDSELVRFSREIFFDLLEHYPRLLMQITRMLIGRLKTSDTGRIQEKTTVIAVVPGAGIDIRRWFLPGLTRTLTTFGSLRCIDGQTVEDAMGTPGISRISRDDPNNIRVSAWLNFQEESHGFLILVADPVPSHWTRRCLAQADQVLIVAEAAGNPAPGPAEAMTHEAPFKELSRMLVLLHPDGNRPPANTAAWLECRQPLMHLHLRMHRQDDMNRLGRILAGRAVGVALSGGGARGFAHVGALEALEASGIPVDIICGTSMGALMAAQFAVGWDFQTMRQKNGTAVREMGIDLTFPIVSLSSGAALVRALKLFLGEVNIEDLWQPYFCVSSNLTRAQVRIHDRGSLRKAVQASNAAPGIFPPVEDHGDLLVDGAFLSNLPADILANRHQVKIIAVDVSPPVDLEGGGYGYGDTLSGWKVLWSRLNPFARNLSVPTITTILRRSGELASVASQRNTIQGLADLYLRIPVEQYGLQDYRAALDIMDIGRNHVRAVLESDGSIKSVFG